MKRVNQLAHEYSYCFQRGGVDDSAYCAYIAGFDKALELAYNMCWDECGAQCELKTIDILKIGEEEV